MDKRNKKVDKHYSITPGELAVSDVHHYLLSTIAPRPIGFVSTCNKDGQANLSPFSFFNVFGANPPMLIFSPARRVRDNTIKHTLENVIENPEAVVNIVDFQMVEQMSLASTEYDAGVNEFIKSGFSEVKSDIVGVPRVGESPASFECKVSQVIETGKEGGAGNLVICEIVKIHLRKDILDENNRVDLLKLDLVGRMGGNYYTRSNKMSFFEIPKPILTKGIGIDSLPASAQNSLVLTGNNLGRLGNAQEIPSLVEIEEAKAFFKSRRSPGDDQQMGIEFIHREVQRLIEEDDLSMALALLWVGDQL